MSASETTSIPITDSDLLERLALAEGAPLYATTKALVEQEQASRNHLSTLTPIQRRQSRAKQSLSRPLADDEIRQHIHHIHSVLALCSFPYRRPQTTQHTYTRQFMKNSLTVIAGVLKNPVTGDMEEQGLPYGTKARLLMLHICTQALRQRRREVEIGDSLSGLIRDLGFHVTGGKNGTVALFKNQLHRLAAANMSIGLWHPETQHSKTIKTNTIESFDIWLDSGNEQSRLWSNTVTLSQDFYDSLSHRAMPVDMRALTAFTHSAKQMDMVLWLIYRLRNVSQPCRISWPLLQEQFGFEIQNARKFKHSFKEDLTSIQTVLTQLRFTLNDQGLTLYPLDPEKLLIPTKRKTPFRLETATTKIFA